MLRPATRHGVDCVSPLTLPRRSSHRSETFACGIAIGSSQPITLRRISLAQSRTASPRPHTLLMLGVSLEPPPKRSPIASVAPKPSGRRCAKHTANWRSRQPDTKTTQPSAETNEREVRRPCLFRFPRESLPTRRPELDASLAVQLQAAFKLVHHRRGVSPPEPPRCRENSRRAPPRPLNYRAFLRERV